MYNHQLETFIRVADAGSFNKAAEESYITPTAIIKQINLLEDSNIIRIGSSPMTPAQLLMELWSKVQTVCPDIKFQIVPFENTPENAREILANLGTNIDVVGGIFDETMLNLRKCAGLELVGGPFYCAVSIHWHSALPEPDTHGPAFSGRCQDRQQGIVRHLLIFCFLSRLLHERSCGDFFFSQKRCLT